MEPPREPKPSVRRFFSPGDVAKFLMRSQNIKYFVLLLIVVILAFLNESFFTWRNISNILRQASVLWILGIGMTFVIITKGIDLSVAGVMSLCGCVCAIFLNKGYAIPIAMGLAILLGMFFGFVNGVLVSQVGLPPFVATYGVKFIADGLALIVMGGNILFGFPPGFRYLGTGFIDFSALTRVFGIEGKSDAPMLVLIAFALVAAFHIVLSRTKLGRQVFCVGANVAASYYSGIRMKMVLLVAFMLSGTMAAMGGILQTARMNAAQAGMGDSFQMLTVACVVMGGTSMSGGEGGIPGTVVGALILTLIVNGMNLMGIPPLAQSLITGAVIILAVMLDVQAKKVRLPIKNKEAAPLSPVPGA